MQSQFGKRSGNNGDLRILAENRLVWTEETSVDDPHPVAEDGHGVWHCHLPKIVVGEKEMLRIQTSYGMIQLVE